MTLPAGFTLRPATVRDAALIQSQRTAMFTDMGSDAAGLARVHEAGAAWHARMLACGAYTGLLVESGGEVVAGAGILWTDLPPNADTAATTRAYVLNVYVQPAQRGRRLARTLMEAALAECRARGVDIVTLTASNAGRPTYEALGFVPQREMKLLLPPVNP
ncbi:GNAT family N-acetyltransferase [Deinococcus aquaticus]|uniref:GNAT family N-acetyltransferase n=1 Tax=Deinococcus aquaticus TaxID=328692 RepID=A0ABY7V2U6_9DEIO|nr:GNAT family N-acetyltransferase [Deinococcus aquaticus]WDA59509.1 GNAT family N-acetyltransferase [Deinococcus aquaticus]